MDYRVKDMKKTTIDHPDDTSHTNDMQRIEYEEYAHMLCDLSEFHARNLRESIAKRKRKAEEKLVLSM